MARGSCDRSRAASSGASGTGCASSRPMPARAGNGRRSPVGHRRCRAAWLGDAAERLLARFPNAPAEERARLCLPRRTSRRRDHTVPALTGSPVPVVGRLDSVRCGGQVAGRRTGTRGTGEPLRPQSPELLPGRDDSDRAPRARVLRSGRCVWRGECGRTRSQRAAIGSLGWWPPYDPDRVVRALCPRADWTPRFAPRRSVRLAGSASARHSKKWPPDCTARNRRSAPKPRRDRVRRIDVALARPRTAAASNDADTALAATEVARTGLAERFLGFAD